MYHALNCGDTFRPNAGGAHIWVIICDPDGNNRVAIVNFTTTVPNCDNACVVRRGEHQTISRDSIVFYSDARLVDKSKLDEAVARGDLQQTPPVQQALLKRIQLGALESPYAHPFIQSAMRQHLGI